MQTCSRYLVVCFMGFAFMWVVHEPSKAAENNKQDGRRVLGEGFRPPEPESAVSQAPDAEPLPAPEDRGVPQFRPGKKVSRRHTVKVQDGEMSFSDIDGYAVLQGDIVLGTTEEVLRKGAGVESRGIKMDYSGFFGARWSNNVVPYRYTTRVVDSTKTVVESAMQEWESRMSAEGVALDFRPVRTGDVDILEIDADPGDGCWAALGRRGGVQKLNLGTGCSYKSIALHELGHTLGLFHEQGRCDRDTYVAINTANIDPDKVDNFDRLCADFTDVGNYDYCSTMHYPAYAFSTNSLPTIAALKSYACYKTSNGLVGSSGTSSNRVYMGQQAGLSVGDVRSMKNILQETDLVSYSSLPGVANVTDGWYYLRQERGGKYLDVSGSCHGENACKLQLWDIGASIYNNVFYIKRQGSASEYRIMNRKNGDRYVEIDWWNSGANGRQLWVYNWSVTPNQIWTLHRVADNRYVIKNMHSGKVLAAKSSCAGTNGCAVGQWSVSPGNLSQVWILEGPLN